MTFKQLYLAVILAFISTHISAQAIQFPAGSTLNVVNGQVQYQLPAGYIMTGKLVSNPDVEMRVGGARDGSVTCDCTSKDGDCKPFAHGDQAGCSTTNSSCKDCKATSTASYAPSLTADFERLQVKREDPAIVNALSASTRVVPLNPAPGSVLTSVTDALLNQQVIRDDINAIYNSLLTPANRALVLSGEIPANHQLSPFSIDGNVGFLVLPDAAIGLKGTIGVGGGKKYTCKGCSGACKHDSSMGVHYCDGCSSGCTLSWD